SILFFQPSAHPPSLPSFPTRRSSDLLLAAAGIARYQRAALLDVLPQDFVRTARAKGLGERAIVWKHALRNALLPIITLIGLSLPDRKSTRLNSSHSQISYAVFCLKKK